MCTYIAYCLFLPLNSLSLPSLLLAAVSAACFLHYPPSPQWVSVFAVASTYHLVLAFVCFKNLRSPRGRRRRHHRSSLLCRLYSWGRGWIPSHLLGLVLLSLPFACVVSNFSCARTGNEGERVLYLQVGKAVPTNNALLINFRLSSDAEILLLSTDLAYIPNRCQTCKNVYAMCIDIYIPIDLSFCIPPLIVGVKN